MRTTSEVAERLYKLATKFERPLENYQHNDCMSAKLTTDQDDVAINGDLTRYRSLRTHAF